MRAAIGPTTSATLTRVAGVAPYVATLAVIAVFLSLSAGPAICSLMFAHIVPFTYIIVADTAIVNAPKTTKIVKRSRPRLLTIASPIITLVMKERAPYDSKPRQDRN